MENQFGHGALYQEKFGRRRVLRYIGQATTGDRLLFKLVARNWNKVASGAVVLPKASAVSNFLEGNFVELPEFISPAFIAMTDDELLSERGEKSLDERLAWLAERDVQYAWIAPLVTQERVCITYDPHFSGSVLTSHSSVAGVSVQMLRRLLHKYAWYGLTKNALLKRFEDRGKTHGRASEYKRKTGRPNDSQRLGMEVELAGVNVTARDRLIFEKALKRYHINADCTIAETYEFMWDEHYSRTNQYGRYRLSSAKIPSLSAFYRHSQVIMRMNSWNRLKAGRKDGREIGPARGNDSVISGRVGRVFDADGTPFNKELVTFGGDGRSEQFNIGKGTLMLMFDRDSKKAVGWHFYVGEENWGEGYRLALFCALTSKKAHLEYLDIWDAEAFPDSENIKPEFVYVDGGPGASSMAVEALQGLRIDMFTAPPDAPYWKPTVEGGLGHTQNSQANKPGGYRRGNRARDKDRKRIAKLTATEGVWKTERDIVLHLIKYNAALDKRHLLTYEMKLDDVPPSSNDIFSWGIQHSGDVFQRLLPEPVVYMSLLSRVERQVTERGVSFLGNQYASSRLLEERALRGRNFKADFRFHPYRPREIYWLMPSGALDRLHRDAASERANGRLTFDEMHLRELRLNASAIAEAAKSKLPARKKGVLTGSQRDNLLAAAGLQPKKVRKRSTPNEENMRRLTGAISRAESDYDKPERHAPELAGALLKGQDSLVSRQRNIETSREIGAPALSDASKAKESGAEAVTGKVDSQGIDDSRRVSASDLFDALWNGGNEGSGPL